MPTWAMLQHFEVLHEFGKQGHSRQNYLYYYFSIMHATRKKDLQRKPQMCGNAFKCRPLGDDATLLWQAFCLDAFPAPWNPKSADFFSFYLEY